MKIKSRFLCSDCQNDIKKSGEYFTLINEIWFAINNNSKIGFLCIGCAEQRLQRKLNKSDFANCGCNDLNNHKWYRSERFINRLTGELK